ncbi:MAG: ABC transporter substrate-binding protein [candidate division NC10 bacterium]|mgnify:FL=1
MTRGTRRAAVLGVLALAAAGPAWAQAPAPEPAPAGQPPEPALGSPTAQMRDYTSEVLKALQEAVVQEADRVGTARLAARKLANPSVGLSEAAQEALGRHWEARTPAEREEFIQLFADLLEATYIAQLDKQRGLRIRYVGESIDGERAQVRARLTTRKGDEAMLEARLSRREGRWLIYDVVFEGISLMGNFRSQFESILRKSSYASLIVQLKAKRDHLLGKADRPGG